MRAYTGSLEGRSLRIGIVAARFNSFVTERLVAGARQALVSNGVGEDDITLAWVPGSFELPLVAQQMAGSGEYNAVVCLGAVIRGETAHFEHVSTQAAHGILQAGLATRVPVIFGVLTTDTVEQARARAGESGNKGAEAALAAIEVANLLKALQA